MQSGRITPIFRQFFSAALSSSKGADSNAEQQKQQQGEPDREPTQEEAAEALKRLLAQEEFQKNSLQAELRQIDGRATIVVTNSLGAQLKMIRGVDILRLLDDSMIGRKGPHLGRILDRRI